MLTTLSPSNQQFLNNLNRISDQLQNAQLQISSGSKINQPSDAPDSISALLAARARLSTNTQTLSNLGQFKTETDAGEQALQSAVTLFDNVQTLGTQGATTTLTAAQQQTIAQQLDTNLQEFVGITGTAVNGRFIFSGDSDQTVPYTYTAGAVSPASPVSTYQGSASTRQAQDTNGNSFPVSLTAQQIFDSTDPTTNVFTSIQNLSAAMKSGDNTAIQTAVNALPKVAAYLNTQLATYGNAQDQIANATATGQTQQTQIKGQISDLQDADLSASILQLTQSQTQEQAALQAEAQIPRTTLFNFLG